MKMRPVLILLQALSTGGATPPQTSGAPAIVDRLDHDLLCLCGRCDRLPLAECACEDAKKERASLMREVSAQDLTTADARERAYQAVRARYVARFGKEALATSPGMTTDAWVYVGWLAAAAAGGGILLFLSLTRWRHWRPAFQRRPWRTRKRSAPPRRRR